MKRFPLLFALILALTTSVRAALFVTAVTGYQVQQGMSKGQADTLYAPIGASKAALGATFGTAKYPVDLFASAPGGYGPGWSGAPPEPQLVVPEPTLATIYVSGTSPKSLPTGNDTTGDGSYATPYASVWKALNSTATYGGVKILVDGTTTENSSGRMIVPKAFTNWVLVDSYTGRPEDFVMTAQTTSSPVFQIRSAAAGFLQIRNCTFRTSADGQQCVSSLPTAAIGGGGPVRFFDCIFEVRRATSGTGRAIDIQSDFWNCTALQFIGCSFKATGGGANLPVVILATPTTNTVNTQPYSNIGMWRCRTTDANWSDWSYRMSGINGYTVVDSSFSTAGNHAITVGTDESGVTYGKCTNVYIGRNYLNAAGSDGHGAILGSNSTGVIFEYNTVVGTVQGIVVKGANNAWIRRNWVSVTGSIALNGIYNKASSDVRFLDNFVYVQRASGVATSFREGWDSASTVRAGNTTLVGNWLIADGSSNVSVLQWGPTSDSSGGGVSYRNVYEGRNGAVLGTVRNSAVTTIAAAKAAWAAGLTGDLSTNETGSVLNDTTYNDTSFTGTSGTSYYCRYVSQNGQNFGGLITSTYDPAQHSRWTWKLFPSAASATTFVRPVPVNLPAGNYSVVVHQQLGLVPAPSDPIVSQQALAYSH